MSELTEFLLARIAEDEKIAKRRHWHNEDCDSCNPDADGDTFPCDCGVPERLAAECEAKRRIVEMHGYMGDDCAGHPGPFMPHDDYGEGFCRRGDEDHYELRHLAAVYADHPDCREEWVA